MNVRSPWFVAGFLAGCAIGGSAALLFAPTSGKDLIAAIRAHFERARQDAHEAGQRAEADVLARYRAIRNASAPGEPVATSTGVALRP
jgi:gas vesicle protein